MLYDASPAIVYVIVLLGVPALVLFSLRVYVRLRRGAWGVDDWLLVASIPLFIGFAVFGIMAAANGTGAKGRHLEGLNVTRGVKYFFISSILYLFAIWLVKLSFGALLYRVARGQRVYEWAIFATMALFSIVTIVSIVFVCLSCRPISANWNPSPNAKCLSHESLFQISYANGIVNIVTDWTYSLLPIPLLWNVSLSVRTKTYVCCLFAMGLFVSIAAIWRVHLTVAYIYAGTENADYLYHLGELMIWNYSEVAIGIVAGSGATLRPLFDRREHITNCENTYDLEDRSNPSRRSAQTGPPGSEPRGASVTPGHDESEEKYDHIEYHAHLLETSTITTLEESQPDISFSR